MTKLCSFFRNFETDPKFTKIAKRVVKVPNFLLTDLVFVFHEFNAFDPIFTFLGFKRNYPQLFKCENLKKSISKNQNSVISCLFVSSLNIFS